MSNVNSFCILGGDKRQVSLAKSLLKDRQIVFTLYLEKIFDNNYINKIDINQAIENSENIILPLPLTKDKRTLNAPFANNEILIDEDFVNMLNDKIIYCGLKNDIIKLDKAWEKLNLVDYSIREDFAIYNAIPTSEGAIQIAINEYEGTINNANLLVVGYGRIGKILSRRLKDLGAKITVTARKNKDLYWIDALGYRSMHTYKIADINDYDIIFNTVPHQIFNQHILKKIEENKIIIDLASLPGGVDLEFAKKCNIKTIHALSLPGLVAPKTAGEIIKKTIYNIIEERTQ